MRLWKWVRASRARSIIAVALVVVAIPAIGLAWWLGSPLFLNKTVNEEFPITSSAAQGQANVEALLTGSFRDEDRLHKGSGEATIYDLGEDGHTLRLEDFSVTNGPDLFVLLMKDPEGRDTDLGYVDLGGLKGNRGSQNYEIPSDVDLSEYNAVMIYCRAFHVVFSTAPLADA